MPVYVFRLLPDDGSSPASIAFNDDGEALDEARNVLRDLRVEITAGRPLVTHIEIRRGDGSLVGRVSP